MAAASAESHAPGGGVRRDASGAGNPPAAGSEPPAPVQGEQAKRTSRRRGSVPFFGPAQLEVSDGAMENMPKGCKCSRAFSWRRSTWRLISINGCPHHDEPEEEVTPMSDPQAEQEAAEPQHDAEKADGEQDGETAEV